MSNSKMFNESLGEEEIYEATAVQKCSVQHVKKYCAAYQKFLKGKGSSEVPEISVKFGSQTITFNPNLIFHIQNSASLKTSNQDL